MEKRNCDVVLCSNYSEVNGLFELNLFYWIGFKFYSFDNCFFVKYLVYIRLFII